MSEGQFGAQGAITTTTTASQAPDAAAADTAKREKRELAKAYEESPGSWSARARREGCDIFVSGFKTQAAAEKELRNRVAYLEKHGKTTWTRSTHRTDSLRMVNVKCLVNEAEVMRKIPPWRRKVMTAEHLPCRLGPAPARPAWR